MIQVKTLIQVASVKSYLIKHLQFTICIGHKNVCTKKISCWNIMKFNVIIMLEV